VRTVLDNNVCILPCLRNPAQSVRETGKVRPLTYPVRR
jgi:hypothetical protein